jgi:hypothetical protein
MSAFQLSEIENTKAVSTQGQNIENMLVFYSLNIQQNIQVRVAGLWTIGCCCFCCFICKLITKWAV